MPVLVQTSEHNGIQNINEASLSNRSYIFQSEYKAIYYTSLLSDAKSQPHSLLVFYIQLHTAMSKFRKKDTIFSSSRRGTLDNPEVTSITMHVITPHGLNSNKSSSYGTTKTTEMWLELRKSLVFWLPRSLLPMFRSGKYTHPTPPLF